MSLLNNPQKAAPKKKTTPAKTEAAKKDDVFVIQSSGRDYTMSNITNLCKEAYRNDTRKHIKSFDVYLKAENGGLRAYYVITAKLTERLLTQFTHISTNPHVPYWHGGFLMLASVYRLISSLRTSLSLSISSSAGS